jgi:alkylation response protein AidB-like acyl-CoA dehydrogenase
MNFGFSEEQDLLRSEARKFLDAQAPMGEVRRVMETPAGYAPDVWKQLGELGWIGLPIPEAYGGAGLSWIDLVVLLEETGRSLFPSPLISTTLAASALLDAGSEEQRRRWLPGLADGSRIGTLALLDTGGGYTPAQVRLRAEAHSAGGVVLRGEKAFVADASSADLFIVAFRSGDAPDAIGLAVVEAGAPGVAAETFPTLDATKRMGRLQLGGVHVRPEALLGANAASAFAKLVDRGAIAITAEALGAAERAHALTVQYAKDRVQFGSPIGRFQGVKHPLAEMFVEIESAKSLLYYAAWALEHAPDELARAVSRAKAYASEAFIRVGIDSIQLHGAVGYTEECDVQLYLKRSKWVRPMFGDAVFHYERLARLRGL